MLSYTYYITTVTNSLKTVMASFVGIEPTHTGLESALLP